MPRITIDGKEVECREGTNVLQAALEAGWDIPHYCYHPGLSVVASCRLCLMEMQMPHPRTGEMSWAPKLFPACQTPARDGLTVRFDSEVVRQARNHCMEYFLLNHPLDCPVCDQAGECSLQDYSYKFGQPTSRMVDPKLVNPKKDVGPRTWLYSDRCVLCSRCVRFTREISGTGELCVTNRGHRNEIDAFPGIPLDNAIQGNVVDICPVGALLDKDFLFKQRVWFLQSAPSVCPGCGTGCAIRIDANDNVVHRIKPRYNPGVNGWWMCDEGRFGWKYVHDPGRLTAPRLRRGADVETPQWEELARIIALRFGQHVEQNGSAGVFCVLSPMMSCEEAWLLAVFVRKVAPEVTLVVGHVPVVGEEQTFPAGASGDDVKFTIRNQKCPNRAGIEMIVDGSGCPTVSLDEFVEKAGKGEVPVAWIVGAYPDKEWVSKDLAKAAAKIGLLVVQELFENKLTEAATMVLPSCAFAERQGCFVNAQGKVQPFRSAIRPIDGCRRDGQYLYELAGYEGVYNAVRVRELMAATLPQFAAVAEAPAMPVHQH